MIHDKCRNVFFLSREGEFLKKLFDNYQKENKFIGSDYIHTHYLIASRKATFLPSLKDLDSEDFFVLFRQYRRISLFDFLSSLNFDEAFIDIMSHELSCDIMKREDDFPTSELFRSLKSSKTFRTAYESKRKEQYHNFITYLDQYGVDYRNDGLFLVDVGWKGSIQDNISNIVGEKVHVIGYYLGLVAPGNLSDHNLKSGILFQNCNGRTTNNYPIYDVNRSIFEMVLAATHGSANGYTIQEGRAIAQTFYDEKEQLLYRNIISSMQDEIFNLFHYICSSLSFSDCCYEDYARQVAKIHAEMVLFPSKKEIQFFRNMYHYENFGVFEYTEFNKKDVSLFKRLKNVVRFIHDPHAILDKGFWAPLTLENAGLGFLKRAYGQRQMRKFKNLINSEKIK